MNLANFNDGGVLVIPFPCFTQHHRSLSFIYSIQSFSSLRFHVPDKICRTLFTIFRTGGSRVTVATKKYDFKFKDYMWVHSLAELFSYSRPIIFKKLRERFGLDAADYMVRYLFLLISNSLRFL